MSSLVLESLADQGASIGVLYTNLITWGILAIGTLHLLFALVAVAVSLRNTRLQRDVDVDLVERGHFFEWVTHATFAVTAPLSESPLLASTTALLQGVAMSTSGPNGTLPPPRPQRSYGAAAPTAMHLSAESLRLFARNLDTADVETRAAVGGVDDNNDDDGDDGDAVPSRRRPDTRHAAASRADGPDAAAAMMMSMYSMASPLISSFRGAGAMPLASPIMFARSARAARADAASGAAQQLLVVDSALRPSSAAAATRITRGGGEDEGEGWGAPPPPPAAASRSVTAGNSISRGDAAVGSERRAAADSSAADASAAGGGSGARISPSLDATGTQRLVPSFSCNQGAGVGGAGRGHVYRLVTQMQACVAAAKSAGPGSAPPPPLSLDSFFTPPPSAQLSSSASPLTVLLAAWWPVVACITYTVVGVVYGFFRCGLLSLGIALVHNTLGSAITTVELVVYVAVLAVFALVGSIGRVTAMYAL